MSAPSPNIERIVENIRRATKGFFHTDEKLLMETIINMTPADQEALDGYYVLLRLLFSL